MNAGTMDNAVSDLARVLENGKFALTAEVTPPLSGAPEALLEKARPFRGVVDAVNVTDGASARVHMSSLAAAALLAADGIEPILQMTCRYRNRIALESDILGASALGVRNILVLRGDDPSVGDHPEAKPVFDFESRELLQVAGAMATSGMLPSGRKITPPPALFLGAADTPIDPPDDWIPQALIDKADAGARFIQTQFCFDTGIVRRYAQGLARAGLADRLSVLIGIGPLASARSALWMRKNLWGTTIPDAIIERLEGARQPKEEGIAICAELLVELAEIPGIGGAHLMAPLNEAAVPAAVAQSGLRKA
ncbi:MAG: methylenetetrahydrofolate reductase [Alphaproteobacteria bacterium]|nr:methylenetetrahydrofolate reductase [Alphaproteobacteria bacterium]